MDAQKMKELYERYRVFALELMIAALRSQYAAQCLPVFFDPLNPGTQAASLRDPKHPNHEGWVVILASIHGAVGVLGQAARNLFFLKHKIPT